MCCSRYNIFPFLTIGDIQSLTFKLYVNAFSIFQNRTLHAPSILSLSGECTRSCSCTGLRRILSFQKLQRCRNLICNNYIQSLYIRFCLCYNYLVIYDIPCHPFISGSILGNFQLRRNDSFYPYSFRIHGTAGSISTLITHCRMVWHKNCIPIFRQIPGRINLCFRSSVYS